MKRRLLKQRRAPRSKRTGYWKIRMEGWVPKLEYVFEIDSVRNRMRRLGI